MEAGLKVLGAVRAMGLPVLTDVEGTVKYEDLVYGVTLREVSDEKTGVSSKVVMDSRGTGGKNAPELRPTIVILDKKECTFSYFADPMYVFMDEEYNQYEIERDDLGDAVHYIVDGMDDVCEVTFYEGKVISMELPTIVVREVEYTEPAARGDTSGKVMKLARLKGSGYELQVPAFVETGEKIEIDTRTNEFRKRA
mgnify:CR=1 FL=1